MLLLIAIFWDGAFDLRYWAPLTLLSLALLLALALAGTLSLPARGALALARRRGLGPRRLHDALRRLGGQRRRRLGRCGASDLLRGSLHPGDRDPDRGVGAALDRCGLVLGVLATGSVSEVRLLSGDTGAFLAGRLNDPIGYRNGTAALFSFAAWPLLGFAARRGYSSGSGRRRLPPPCC